MFKRFLCFWFGHEPMSDEAEMFELQSIFEEFLRDGVKNIGYLSMCARCGEILGYDAKKQGWIKW